MSSVLREADSEGADLEQPSAKRTKLETAELALRPLQEENMASNRVVLLLCGSFSPITNLHLRMLELARDCLQKNSLFSVVRGIISPVHDAYGKKGLVESHHRVAMCKLAAQNSDWITVDPWETQQGGWTVTANVLRHFQEAVNADKIKVGRIKLLCGADLLESFATPGLWESADATPGLWESADIDAIVRDFGLVVISRSGSNPEKFIYESDQLSRLKANISLVTEWIPNDISSTKIRRSLQRGESVRYLVPDAVLDYIQHHKLYQNDES
jgi:nicotinate (nicotinamide) nucleotide adenylyltransferase